MTSTTHRFATQTRVSHTYGSRIAVASFGFWSLVLSATAEVSRLRLFVSLVIVSHISIGVYYGVIVLTHWEVVLCITSLVACYFQDDHSLARLLL